jgi:hypothetical protein
VAAPRSSQRGVFEVGLQRQLGASGAGGCQVDADQRRVDHRRGRLAQRAAGQHGGAKAAHVDHRQIGVVLKRRFAPTFVLGQGNPQLGRVQARAVHHRVLGVRDAAPGRHQVDLAGADDLLVAQRVAVHHFASIIQVKVCSPMCGCAPTCMPLPGANCTGPAWSRKHQAPTVRRARWGSARATRVSSPTMEMRER